MGKRGRKRERERKEAIAHLDMGVIGKKGPLLGY